MELKPILCKKHYSCFENTIYNLANLFEKEYKYIFMDSWNFYYNSFLSEFIDERLCDNRYLQKSLNEHQANLLKKYHGIEIEWIDNNYDDIQLILNFVKKQNTAAIVETKVQYIGWNKLQQSNDVYHYFLIIYNNALNDFCCIDGHFSNEIQDVKQVDFSNINKIGIINIKSELPLEPNFVEVAKHAAISCINGDGEISDFQMLEDFAKDLIVTERNNKPLIANTSIIVRRIHYISNGRQNLYELLNSLEHENTNDKKYILDALAKISMKWNIVKNLLIKWIYQEKVSILCSVSKQLLEIVSLEKQLSNYIILLN